MASLGVDSEQEPLLGDRTPKQVSGCLGKAPHSPGASKPVLSCVRLSGQNKGCQSSWSRRQRDWKMRRHFQKGRRAAEHP